MIDLALKLLPPQEAIDFFRAKGYKIGFDHRDVWQSEHQNAFTVAKAMELDLLADIRAAVDAALAEGTTLKTFVDGLRPLLMKRGWWGTQEVTDPKTGEQVLARLGSPRRLKVIFDTNLRTAHAEGQWQRIQTAKQALPYLLYDHTPSPFERPEHAAWDGLVLPVDDPWWQRHMPVKAWGCKCRVIQLGDRQLKRMRKTVDTAPAESWTEYTNQRTGETQSIPAGVDPAFHYPPLARKQALQEMLEEKEQKAAQVLAAPPAAAARQLTTIEDFVAAGKDIVDSLPDAGSDPVAFHQALIARLQSEVGISTPCKTVSRGAGAKTVQQASKLFPDTWTAASDRLGPLYVKGKANARGYNINLPAPMYPNERVRLPDFGVVAKEVGASYMLVRPGVMRCAVHEFSHRLQAALPDVDALFAALHRRRTVWQPIEPLSDVCPGRGYGRHEVTRKDKYADPYQGKEYGKGEPLEVMTMALEAVLGAGETSLAGNWRGAAAEYLRTVYTKDREMVDFTVGLLFHWRA